MSQPESVRIHRSGSVEVTRGSHHYHLPTETSTTAGLLSHLSPSRKSSSINVNDLQHSSSSSPQHHSMKQQQQQQQQPVSSPYLSPSGGLYRSSRLASSVLGQTSFSSNIHNSRAVLSALRALQDKIRNLETERSQFSHQCSSLQVELSNAKNKLQTEENTANIEAQRLEQTTTDFSRQKQTYEIETARSQEKLAALKMEMDMVKEQAQRSATERKSAIDRLARVEIEAEQSGQTLITLKAEVLSEQKSRRAAEQRVTELQELVNRLMTTNEELASSSTKRRKRTTKLKKKTTKKFTSSTSTTSSRNTKSLSRARKKQADRDRAAAAKSREHSKSNKKKSHGMSLKEQVRLANLGKDPPFMPSGNPRVDNNIYSITQKQLANPEAYGNTPSSSSSSHQLHSQYSQHHSSHESPPLAPSSVASSYVPIPESTTESSGLDTVIEAIRHELNALTVRRDTLLQNAANSSDGHLNLDQRTIDIALSDLQKKIDSKSRQVVLLEKQLAAQNMSDLMETNHHTMSHPIYVEAKKRHQHRHYSPRSPLRDTEASDKKQAALDLLRNYKNTSVENEMNNLHELQGRSMAATYSGGDSNEGTTTSARRGTYYGTYDSSEAQQLRELHKTASSFGMN